MHRSEGRHEEDIQLLVCEICEMWVGSINLPGFHWISLDFNDYIIECRHKPTRNGKG